MSREGKRDGSGGWGGLRRLSEGGRITSGLLLAVGLLLAGAPAAEPVAAPQTLTATLPGGATLALVWIAPGSFLMGSPAEEPGREPDEGPVRRVTLDQGFWLGAYPLTQGQWRAVMERKPWRGKSLVRDQADHPAVYISWEEVQALIDKLNGFEGRPVYRLPTEAEWEYACRAGTTSRWSFGEDERRLGEYAWYQANAWAVGLRYAPAVGGKRPNGWGLYDMHGLVFEWCQDGYGPYPGGEAGAGAAGAYRVVRGGDFSRPAAATRSAYRYGGHPAGRGYNLGVRLVREP
jgi:formylglycine-generating enzyme